MAVSTNKKLQITLETTYLFELLRDEVVCKYITPLDKYKPEIERLAVFEFKSKVAAFHAIPITLPLAMCDHYMAEMPEVAQA